MNKIAILSLTALEASNAIKIPDVKSIFSDLQKSIYDNQSQLIQLAQDEGTKFESSPIKLPSEHHEELSQEDKEPVEVEVTLEEESEHTEPLELEVTEESPPMLDIDDVFAVDQKEVEAKETSEVEEVHEEVQTPVEVEEVHDEPEATVEVKEVHEEPEETVEVEEVHEEPEAIVEAEEVHEESTAPVEVEEVHEETHDEDGHEETHEEDHEETHEEAHDEEHHVEEAQHEDHEETHDDHEHEIDDSHDHSDHEHDHEDGEAHQETASLVEGPLEEIAAIETDEQEQAVDEAKDYVDLIEEVEASVAPEQVTVEDEVVVTLDDHKDLVHIEESYLSEADESGSGAVKLAATFAVATAALLF